MSTWPDPRNGQPAKHLYPAAKWILIVWAALTVGLAIYGFLGTGDSEGFADLASALVAILGLIALAAVGVIALLIRQYVKESSAQTMAALFGPPVVAFIAFFLLRYFN